MREIEFRAWDKINKWMTEIVCLNLMGVDCILKHPKINDTYNIPYKCVIIEQYTGMKDENGKKIYEGDIVQFTWWWFDGNECDSLLTGLIVYSEVNMSFQLKGVKNKEWQRHTGYGNNCEYLTPFSELNFSDAEFAIIGNVHETPELLKGSKV